jgi:enoyl-CoA hydratase
MPETGIGLFPDVGGGWYLPRLPGRVGEFMALTGARLDGAECHYLGLATHYAEQASLPEMIDRIATTPQRVQGPIGAFTTPPPDAKIEKNLPLITKLFASDRLEDVLAALEADDSDWAQTELATLKSKSPLSCKVSLRLLAEGANRASFAEEMKAEYALGGRIVRTHDFREGVRALLIDKTGDPKWDPATPEEVTDEMLDILFAPLPEADAWTPFPETQE